MDYRYRRIYYFDGEAENQYVLHNCLLEDIPDEDLAKLSPLVSHKACLEKEEYRKRGFDVSFQK